MIDVYKCGWCNGDGSLWECQTEYYSNDWDWSTCSKCEGVGAVSTFSGPVVSLKPNDIFVFGSNTEGRHGKGAALWALKNAGAKYGQAMGPQGQSYAIITKNLSSPTHPSINEEIIIKQIRLLYLYAELHPKNNFIISYSNTKKLLNGYSAKELANMFFSAFYRDTYKNIFFDLSFAQLFF